MFINSKVKFNSGFKDALQKTASESDILKVIAVLAVIWQGILGILMKQPYHINQKVEMVILSDFFKFSAPFFIFAICFDISKIKDMPYPKYLTHKVRELLIPYFCWATVYILMNIQNYKTMGDLLQGYLFGTVAPHTWYLVMMFQFQILVPILWYLYGKTAGNGRIALFLFVTSFLFYLSFLLFYGSFIFHKTENKALLYLDRSFIGFSIYAILGTIASANREKWNSLVSKIKFFAIPFLLISFLAANNEMFSNGLKNLTLENCIYLKPSIFFYNLFAILLAYGLALTLIRYKSRILPAFRFLSQYAYRAYLVNYFVITVIMKTIGKYDSYTQLNLHLILLWIVTSILSFTLVYAVEFVMRVCYQCVRGEKAVAT